MHFRFLSPLAAVPFVTLTGLGLFFFAFPGVSSRHSRLAFFGRRSLLANHSSFLQPQVTKCIEVGLPALVLLVIFAEVTATRSR